ncbi:hypothetical protein GCK32_012371, partial [Trichostrongylus colubriformis]
RLNEHGVGAVWLSEEKALEVTAKNDSFYFVPAFRGRVFEHLMKLKVNLYGSHVVLQTLINGGSLPRWDFPVFSLNMTGACVCFTGLPLDRREDLKAKINYMNGIVSPCLTEKVTHLVTDYCDTASKKYTEARRMSLPVMLPEWIEKAWEAAQHFSVDLFTSKEVTRQYRTPIFNKMVITATGVSGSERVDIARLIELNGGRFSGDMKRNQCTHLIADQAKGMKYKKAREWNSIKIVRCTWLRKSVVAGYVLPENAFDPEKRNRCSTPVKESQIVEPEELDCSVIQVTVEEFLWDPEDIICRTTSFISAQPLEETPRRPNAEVSSRPTGSATTTKDLGASDYLNIAPLGNISDDPDLSSIFRALKFRLSGLCGDVESQTIKELTSAGGKVVPPSDVHTLVNYLVCGNVEFSHV